MKVYRISKVILLFLLSTLLIAFQASDVIANDYCYTSAGDGSKTATWTPDISLAGMYHVYAWWKADTDRAFSVEYIVNFEGSSEVFIANQQDNGRNKYIFISLCYKDKECGLIM